MPILMIIIAVFVTLIATIFLTPIGIALATKHNFLDLPGQHKRHKQPTPLSGGLVLFVSFWVTMIVMVIVSSGARSELRDPLPFIFAGAVILTLVGFSDDLKPVSAWVKLLAQIAVGYLLYLGGLSPELLWTPFGGTEIGPLVAALITISWVVVLTNAINLIDGLDGLASGVSLIAAVTLIILGEIHTVGASLIFVASIAGFSSAFLYFNRYPARIFLGDSGSMQLGYYFAVYSLIFPMKSITAAALFAPLLALGVPILETSTSLLRRLISGKSVMKADRRHLFHYLSLLGFSPQKVVWMFYLLALIFGGFAVAISLWNKMLVLTILVLFMVVISVGFLILMSKSFPRKHLSGRGDGSF